MTDLIHRQAAIDALGEEPLVWCDGENEIAERNQWRHDVAAIKALPSEDVAEVVRCKDCRLSEPGIGIVEYWCCYWDNKTLENGYCSYGERKDG